MATVLLAWELGAGIGHLMNLRPIGRELVKRGHRVVAVVRDLLSVDEVFAGTGIAFMPAPIIPRRGPAPYEPTLGFAHILGNIGFANERALATLFAAWNTIFDQVRPDLVVADHSPTALLALRGCPIRRVNIGLGFFCPPDTFPLPIWTRPNDGGVTSSEMARVEQELTGKVNRILETHRRPKVQRLGQLFNEIDEVFLATYREFDHYGPQPKLRYWGHWPFAPGVEPVWPAGSGPKIYAYLKPFGRLEALLHELRQSGSPTIVLSGGIDPALQARYAGPTMRYEQRPLDLRRVAAECDLAVLNANHGTAAALLLAGKPCVLAPMYLEQLMFARKVEQLGAARLVLKDEVPLTGILEQTLGACRESAQAFAQRYAAFQPGSQIPELVDRLHQLVRRPAAQFVNLPLTPVGGI
jgi:UDP:flavonoid glycosyltransferase YjiC (YdhE family)